MAVKTAGVTMKFTNEDGTKSWSKTLNGLSATVIDSADAAKDFAQMYGVVVDGTLTGASLVETTPLDLS